MSPNITNIFLIFAGILLLFIVWAASIGFVYWDVYRRNLPWRQQITWIAVVVLLPVIGFGIYLFARYLYPGLSQISKGGKSGLKKRHTLPMYVPQKEVYLPTLAMEVEPSVDEQRRVRSPAAPPARPRSVYLFSLIQGPGAGRDFVMQEFPAWIGRDPEAPIRLFDRSVSRKHAEIYQVAGGVHIRDLNSTHGTLVNGNWIAEQRLEPGDEVQVGASILRFRLREGSK